MDEITPMTWQWLRVQFTYPRLVRLAIKVVVCLVLVNLGFAVLHPMIWLDRATIYGSLVPFRTRFSYASPGLAVTVLRVDAMFASHEISGPKLASDEYRVAVMGASDVWGFGLNANETISACLNQNKTTTPQGHPLRVFNLGYPAPSAMRDLIFLDKARIYNLDHVVWFINAGTLYRYLLVAQQEFMSINREALHTLLAKYPIQVSEPMSLPPESFNLWEQTLIGQRVALNTWVQDQLYGLVWQQQRIDHLKNGVSSYHPTDPEAHGEAFGPGAFADWRYPGEVTESDLSLDVLAAGVRLARSARFKLTLVAQPMWIQPAETRNFRYNEEYPIWYYDMLQTALRNTAATAGWDYVDWSAKLPNGYFTDSPFHYSAEGSCILAAELKKLIRNRALP